MNRNLDFTGLGISAPIEELKFRAAELAGVRLFIQREDKLHNRLSGNKWRKLKYNLIEAKHQGKTTLVTFGGAFSNHIAATAEAGNLFGFSTIGIIRGDAISDNPTLLKAEKLGMQLIFATRTEYRAKAELIEKLKLETATNYIIPEGGTNSLAFKGCEEIIKESSEKNIDYWCVACGTGGTATGMIRALELDQRLIGFSVLKGDFMKSSILEFLGNEAEAHQKKWSINNDYHFGGYAKFNSELIDFINNFKRSFDIQLDPVYTSKLCFGVFDLIKKGYFPSGSKVRIVHTGGQQGILGFNKRFGNIIQNI